MASSHENPVSRHDVTTASGVCPHCQGTGWMHVPIRQDLTAVKRCVCRTRGRADAEKERPGGFQKPNYELGMMNYESPEMGALLNETDRKIARLIEERKGQQHAISIREICEAVFGDEHGYGPSIDAAQQRSVKQTVEKLRMLARMPIAATKRPPYGYYIPVTAEECDECYKRLFGEGVKLIMLSRLFRPDADVVRELEGQLGL